MTTDYPIPLREILSKNAEDIYFKVSNTVSWQLIASYRNGQEDLDRQMEYRAQEQLFHEAIKKKVTVFQDQSNVHGRVYYAEIVAMTKWELENILYQAYRAGVSAVAHEPLKLENV